MQKWEHVEEAAFKWPLPMHEEWPELRHHTRSHSQWVTLIREHAQCTVDDTFIDDLYEKHCFQSDERWACRAFSRAEIVAHVKPTVHVRICQQTVYAGLSSVAWTVNDGFQRSYSWSHIAVGKQGPDSHLWELKKFHACSGTPYGAYLTSNTLERC